MLRRAGRRAEAAAAHARHRPVANVVGLTHEMKEGVA